MLKKKRKKVYHFKKYTIMEQPTIKIKDKFGKDFGDKKVLSLHWNSNGKLYLIKVEFLSFEGSTDVLDLFDYNFTDNFINSYGNLIGILNK